MKKIRQRRESNTGPLGLQPGTQDYIKQRHREATFGVEEQPNFMAAHSTAV
jgi:hypothetical protein